MSVDTPKPDGLNTAVMLDALKHRGLNELHAEVFDALPSTSEYLSEVSKTFHKDAAVEPQLCVTDWQTSGNGRRGKTWVTERGNITFSLLLPIAKPPAELMGLSLVTGLCVVESLQTLAGISPKLKWPNDVLVDDKKCCGLLTELGSSNHLGTRVVVGIGINYTPPAQMAASDFQAVSVPMLSDNPPSRAELISEVCSRVIDAFTQFQDCGWAGFADRWDKVDYLKGRQVRIISGSSEEEHAEAVGVNEQGALLVESNGETRAIFGGDVSMRLA